MNAMVPLPRPPLYGSGTGPQAIWESAQASCGQFARYRGRSMLQEQMSALVA